MPSTSLRALLLLAALTGCTSTWKVSDVDGDGVSPAGGDCWESESSPAGTTLTAEQIYPGATEIWYDGFDQDCAGDDDYDADGDGVAAAGYADGTDCDDEDAGTYPGASDTWYDGVDSDCGDEEDYDADADGYNAEGYGDGGDCDDADDTVNPGAGETWYDGVDQDCADDDDYDADGDGFVVTNDCDDNDALSYPNDSVEEIWYNNLDENCDGNDGDQDGDGYVAADYPYDWEGHNAHAGPGDCWDDPALVDDNYIPIDGSSLSADAVNPAATETWYDGVDQDCAADSDFDADGDGYDTLYHVNRDGGFGEDCFDDPGDDFVNDGGLDPLQVNPGADETWYDDTDADCDGGSDFDADADGHDAEIAGGDDCDDSLAGINPSVDETCSTSFDDNCDGSANDVGATDCTTYYLDEDADGYGTTDSQCTCEEDTANDYTATVSTDCDDDDDARNPGESEVCDSADKDEDCDNKADDDDTSVTSSTKTSWYRDADEDSYGDAATTKKACDEPSGYVSNDDDCDDADDGANPGETEVCDVADTDEDCDGLADDDDSSVASSGKSTYYEDGDADGYGDVASTTSACDLPTGYATDNTDCDDADADRNPGETEICDAADTDEDCDGNADDDDSSTRSSSKSTWYLDSDADNYGTTASTTKACELPSGYASLSTDCDDADASRNPGETEVCDSSNKDEDCDSLADDADSSVSTSTKTTWYLDADGDDYGVAGTTKSQCDEPSGYANNDDDCDDGESARYPGATEVCEDGEVNDCSGTATDAFAECALYGTDDLGTVTDVLLGASASDELGMNVAAAGDVDGDGYANFLVMASVSTDDGIVYLMDGVISASGGKNVSNVDVGAITADKASDMLGLAMAGGDIDGDGYDDLVLGAEGDDSAAATAGAVFVLVAPVTTFGAVSALYEAKMTGVVANDRAGAGVAVLGDVDGDDRDDMLIGADGYDLSTTVTASGAAYLVLGPGSTAEFSLTGAADALFTGEAKNDVFGETVARAGDYNGDGHLDALVGAPSTSSAGKGLAYGFFGAFTGTITGADAEIIVEGSKSGDHIATALAGGGDVDGDGYDDILLGAPAVDGDAGAAYVVLGASGSSARSITAAAADATLTGTAADDGAGTSVAIAQDVDGDGADDLLIGAPGNDDAATGAGAAYLIYGPPSSIDLSIADVIFTGDKASDGAGTAVAGAGDTNGDGYGDLLIGAPYADPSSKTDGGKVYLPLGSSY